MEYTKDQIEELADEYATNLNECYSNDFYGFINGFKMALSLLKKEG